MTSITTSRSAFLDKASLLLASASPAVSAELRSGLENGSENKKPSPQSGPGTCNSCGTILLLGWNSLFVRSTSGKRTRKDRLEKKTTTKALSIQCSSCNAVTTVESIKPTRESKGKATRNTKPVTNTQVSRQAGEKQHRESTPATAASKVMESAPKKRSRNNKKSSLQSMLADRKPTESKKTAGLDIMDFMKT